MQLTGNVHFTNDATGLRKTSPGNTRLIPAFGTGQVLADKNGNGIIEVTNNPATCEIIQVGAKRRSRQRRFVGKNHYYLPTSSGQAFGLNHEGPWLMNDAARDNLYQYNGKEWNADFGLGLYDFGNRWHDPALGRFTTVDRFADKYTFQSPYVMAANDPVKFVDVNGDSVSVIISGPTLSQGQSGSSDRYSNGLAGHVAINIDGKVYSFEGDGKWKTYEYNDYIAYEKSVRHTGEITVSVDQEKIQEAIDLRVDGNYDISNNSCVSNTINILKKGGIPIASPNGAVSPDAFADELVNSEYSINVQKHMPAFDKSFTGRLLYVVVTGVRLEQKITGVKMNTINLIPDKK